MNVGIHFSNRYWEPPAEEHFTILKLARPETIKTLVFPAPRFDQAAVHRRLRQEHPDALIVARLFADMNGGAWSPSEFVEHFAPRIEELRPYVTWFEVHNEPNLDPQAAGYSEGFGASDADIDRFIAWAEEVLAALRRRFPWARWVFPGQAPHRYTEFWNRALPTILKFDAWGVHCYWQGDQHLHPYYGKCYTYAHYLAPQMPIIITEFGDATPGRSPAEKIPIYLEWFRELEKHDYVMGSALYILGGTEDWSGAGGRPNFEVTREMAEAIGRLGRRPRQPQVADGFDFPVGKPDGVGYYVAAGLAEESYYQRFGAWHTGEDWNGVGGGDTDEGDPVYAAAHGRVLELGRYPSWGNIVLLEHRLRDGRRIWTQYAHLKDILVKKGDLVRRGDQIGTIGHMIDKDGNPKGPAHLHFEVRAHLLPPDQWNLPREDVLRFYLHPTDFIRSHRPNYENLVVAVDDVGAGFSRSDSRFWFEGDAGYDGHCYWTWTVSEEQGEDCWAIWKPVIPKTGLYEVFAFIPSRNATTRHARYKIVHRRGEAVVEVNQSEYNDEWVSLGVYAFSTVQPAYVRLSDVTGEPYTRERSRRRQIAFDAVMWVLVRAGDS
ncbi:MAG: peptidoglycan DD-metalloendopeptidase family protein [Anaerolineae bacterium]